jgi:thiamine biosynthesis lipoprotein
MADVYNRRLFLQSLLAGGGLLGAGALLSIFPARRALGHGAVSKTRLFMGTMVSITVTGADAAVSNEGIERAFRAGCEQEQIFTRFTSSSPLAELNRQGALTDIPPLLQRLLHKASSISQKTGGAFDPTILPVLQLVEGKQKRQIPADQLHHALSLVGMEHVDLTGKKLLLRRQGMALSLDGIAKGYIADSMSRELVAAGCPNHCINAGGDIVVSGHKELQQQWRIGISDPHHPNNYLQVLEAGGGAIATSGISRPGHSHLINPATGKDAVQASVTVLAPDCATADALSTAFSVMPPRQALALADTMRCPCCLVQHDGLVRVSRGWTGRSLQKSGLFSWRSHTDTSC